MLKQVFRGVGVQPARNICRWSKAKKYFSPHHTLRLTPSKAVSNTSYNNYCFSFNNQACHNFSSATLANHVDEGDTKDDSETSSETLKESSSDNKTTAIVVRRRNIRGSPKKMNELTRLVSGMYALDALKQMAYIRKRKGLVMRNLINLGAVRAQQDHNIPIENLVIEDAIVGKGPILKRGRFHARGRTGKNYHRFCHLYLRFRESTAKPAKKELQKTATRTGGWSVGRQSTTRAQRRAENAAANAAVVGGKLQQYKAV